LDVVLAFEHDEKIHQGAAGWLPGSHRRAAARSFARATRL
jgi:hypothetical protein